MILSHSYVIFLNLFDQYLAVLVINDGQYDAACHDEVEYRYHDIEVQIYESVFGVMQCHIRRIIGSNHHQQSVDNTDYRGVIVCIEILAVVVECLYIYMILFY